MTMFENSMINLLREMKDEYGLVGVKGEFEAEGASMDELIRLRNITLSADVKMHLKIGGCEAISDICAARTLGVDSIIAPMIESPFAARKFYSAIKTVFPKDIYQTPEVLINIETTDGVRNFDAILSLDSFSLLGGIDIGRVDMAGSFNLSPDESNSTTIYNICENICEKWYNKHPDKPCTIGGFLNKSTIDFLHGLAKKFPIQSESKKTIFCSKTVSSESLHLSLKKAIEFEMLWYKNCMENYKLLSTENWNYFKKLADYYEMLSTV